METRNTPVLREVITVLTPYVTTPTDALDTLETHFQSRLIADAGSVASVRSSAIQLRLSITDDECAVVLDEVVRRKLVMVTLDHVEETVYDLFGNRFIEP